MATMLPKVLEIERRQLADYGMIKRHKAPASQPTRQTHDRWPLGGAHGSGALKGERNGPGLKGATSKPRKVSQLNYRLTTKLHKERVCDALPGAMRSRGGNVGNIEKSHRALVALSQHVSVQAKSEGSRTSRLTASPAAAGCAPIGNCNTVARWPTHRRVSSTTCPSGNSSAS
jgi:hypothetical protein